MYIYITLIYTYTQRTRVLHIQKEKVTEKNLKSKSKTEDQVGYANADEIRHSSKAKAKEARKQSVKTVTKKVVDLQELAKSRATFRALQRLFVCFMYTQRPEIGDCKYIHTYIHAFIHTSIHTYIHTYTHIKQTK